MCKGLCPGTGIDGDWRNKTEYCEVWKRLFEHMERELVDEGRTPISLDPRRRRWEARALETWQRGENILLEEDLG